MSVSVYIPINSRIPFVLQLIVMDLRGVEVWVCVHAHLHMHLYECVCVSIDMRVPQRM